MTLKLAKLLKLMGEALKKKSLHLHLFIFSIFYWFRKKYVQILRGWTFTVFHGLDINWSSNKHEQFRPQERQHVRKLLNVEWKKKTC